MATDIVLGFGCLLLGLGYLFRPDIMSRINEVIKNTILNDAYIELERKKWGVFFILVGIFFLFMAFVPSVHW